MDKNKSIESAAKLIAKGAFDKAVKEYQRVLELDPDDVRILQKLAELYQKMNRKAEAADCFEKVARTYSQQGFYLKAVALYKQVLKVIERVEVNVRLAELYQQLGLVGDATKEWQAVAAYHEKAGDTKASLDTLRKLVDLDPDNVAARIRLGEQYARQDQMVEAVAELRRAAQYLQRNGRHDDYVRVAERISHLDQTDVTLAKELAESYLSRGDSKRALAKLVPPPRRLSSLRLPGPRRRLLRLVPPPRRKRRQSRRHRPSFLPRRRGLPPGRFRCARPPDPSQRRRGLLQLPPIWQRCPS